MASEDAPVTTLAELLAACALEHLEVSSTLSTLSAKLDEGRPPLLDHLKAAGVSKLPERQKLCNFLAKAKRSERIRPAVEEDREAALSRLTPVDISETAAAAGPSAPSSAPLPPTQAAPNEPSRRPRVLCLHAFRTNSRILEMQMRMSGQEALLAEHLELVFADAPHECTPAEEARQKEAVRRFFPKASMGAYREWFNASSVDTGGEGGAYVPYAYKDESIRHVATLLATASPPFDGLRGFSQGGSLAVWIAALQEQGQLELACPPLKWIWVQSARPPRDPSCMHLFVAPLRIPCFISYHADDPEVRPDETRALIARCLDAPVVVERPKGGHALLAVKRGPPEDAEKLKAFLVGDCRPR